MALKRAKIISLHVITLSALAITFEPRLLILAIFENNVEKSEKRKVLTSSQQILLPPQTSLNKGVILRHVDAVVGQVDLLHS